MDGQSSKHLVEFNGEQEKLIISRVQPDGSQVLYTEIAFGDLVSLKQAGSASAVCERLGETLFLDTPVGRDLLDL